MIRFFGAESFVTSLSDGPGSDNAGADGAGSDRAGTSLISVIVVEYLN